MSVIYTKYDIRTQFSKVQNKSYNFEKTLTLFVKKITRDQIC